MLLEAGLQWTLSRELDDAMWWRRLLVGVLALATSSVAYADELSDSDNLFNWAEQSYPELFSPPGAISQIGGGYYFRCYGVTGNCVGTQGGQLYFYYSPARQIIGLGSISEFLSQIGTVDERLIPRFVRNSYIDIDRVAALSLFRSSDGHDYSDGNEICRSMKHYFMVYGTLGVPTVGDPDPLTTRIYSPADGIVTYTQPEWAGTQLGIQSSLYPAYTFILFHVNLFDGIAVGKRLSAGQQIGTHSSSQTNSDIAVKVSVQGGFRLVSFFDTMSDALFAQFSLRGLSSRNSAIISRATRDAAPLSCAADHSFLNAASDPLPKQMQLR